jgi:hypothetical protein
VTAEFHDTGDFTDILYKYTDLAGAQKILSTRTLRFARAAEMNDPFDVYIADLFGMDLDEFFMEARDSFFDALLSNPEHFASATGADLTKALENAARLRTMSDTQRAEMRDRLRKIDFAEVDPRCAEIRATLEKQRDELAERLRRYGVFCATKTFSNLLMWAHYADKHFGAVLGFLPDLEKDSFLRLIRPVKYCTERPYLVDQPHEQIAAGLGPTPLDAGKQLNERVLYTKSMEWSYEQELRLTFPEEIKEGQSATFNTFYANELVEVYLGYRMSEDSKTELIQLSKALNPDVKIFAARLARRKYALEFDPV